MRKPLFLIIGPSGSGKSTLADDLEERYGLKSVSSYTTRPARYKDEPNHIFISDEEFDSLGELVAYTEFNGYRYGITKEILDSKDLYVIDIDGAKMLKEKYRERPIYSFGLILSEREIIERMRKRGDTEEKIADRINHDKIAFKELSTFCDVLLSASFSETQLTDFTYKKICEFNKKGEKNEHIPNTVRMRSRRIRT